MALKNGRSLKTTLQIFFKENARYPDFNEFRKLILGKNAKEKKVVDSNDQEETK